MATMTPERTAQTSREELVGTLLLFAGPLIALLVALVVGAI
ncbi:MAG: hypothetical protein JWN84_345 [Nocardioides sp.]|nr:hypothetical protein [Nocardioides sp.]